MIRSKLSVYLRAVLYIYIYIYIYIVKGNERDGKERQMSKYALPVRETVCVCVDVGIYVSVCL